ncbi:MAG: D-alanyl-D-alanine carboxypeptidase/D-alanyl-D-alanine-endopeptidase, partial [Bacteroidetes bacterium]|nr:D-alanyl-D-alanine carboxypeptidase/D-alanyl-D-alanine-endopeptidase [Bacteroidota bacterium]
VHWIWGDIGNYYGAGSTGLCFNENSFAAYFNSGKEKGDSVKLVKTVPDMKEYNIFNFVTTGPKYSGDKSWFASSPWGNDIFMYGKIGAAEKDFEVEGTIPDPPLLCVSLFRDSLSACGIRVGGQHTTSRLMRRKGIAMDSVRTEMHAWNSKALISIVYMTNKSSVNLYAETMIRMIGVKQRGSGNVSSGTDAVESYWKGKKIDMKGFRMYDGSGLSKHNTVTPLQFCQILDAIQSEKYYKAFYESLPVAGKSGTLASMCKGTSADGKVVAKSGYMSNVRCYAGYVTTQKGSIVTFAIMANNFDCSASAMKKKIEKIFVKMADLSR